MGRPGLNYAVEQRMRLIDFLLSHYGTINRSAIEDYFGISTPQASADIKAYLQFAPGNAVYDQSSKVYRRGPTFYRAFP